MTLDFPRLLVPEAVRVSVYPLETVVAEKFAALVELGLLTTRMKDIYDLSIISAREVLTWDSLHTAVRRSFAARGTPDGRTVLTTDFAADEVLAGHWRQFLRRTGLPAPADTHSVQFPYSRESAACTSISRNTYFFLLPPVGLNPQILRGSIGIRMSSPKPCGS